MLISLVQGVVFLTVFLKCHATASRAEFGGPYRPRGLSPSPSEVTELAGEPSYRAVKLKWRYFAEPESRGFKIRVCELSIWNVRTRCRERALSLDKENSIDGLSDVASHHDTLTEIGKGRYEAMINDLRMTTNYTFTVVPEPLPEEPNFYSDGHPLTQGRNPSYHQQQYAGIPARARNILVTTMGFSARASRCLSNTSDVVVNTGPYFNGKIAVEDTFDNHCAVFGNKSSDQSIYTLQILHSKCGSKFMNNSRIETNIIVHENRDIVTHNSKRFLVVCNFLPETFTIQATVNMPGNYKGAKKTKTLNTLSRKQQTDPNDESNDLFTFDQQDRQHHVRDSRILAEQTAHLDNLGTKTASDSQLLGQMTLLILLVIAAIAGCGVAIWWFVNSAHKENFRTQGAITTITAEPVSPETYVALQSDKDQLVLSNIKGEFDNMVPAQSATNKCQPGTVLRVNVCGTPMALMALRPIGDSEV